MKGGCQGVKQVSLSSSATTGSLSQEHPVKSHINDHDWRQTILVGIQERFSWKFSSNESCQCRRLGFNPRIGKILWRRQWQPTPIFLPGESHGQRSSLVGYSQWGHKESDMTEWLSLTHTHTHTFCQARRSWPALKGRTVAVWKERDCWFSVHHYKVA